MSTLTNLAPMAANEKQEQAGSPLLATNTGEGEQTVQHDPESLLDTDAAGVFLSVSRRTLEHWRCLGKGPRWIRFSRGCVRYRRGDLIEFINAHKHTHKYQFPGRKEQ